MNLCRITASNFHSNRRLSAQRCRALFDSHTCNDRQYRHFLGSLEPHLHVDINQGKVCTVRNFYALQGKPPARRKHWIRAFDSNVTILQRIFSLAHKGNYARIRLRPSFGQSKAHRLFVEVNFNRSLDGHRLGKLNVSQNQEPIPFPRFLDCLSESCVGRPCTLVKHTVSVAFGPSQSTRSHQRKSASQPQGNDQRQRKQAKTRRDGFVIDLLHRLLGRTAGASEFPGRPTVASRLHEGRNAQFRCGYLVTRILEVKPVVFLNSFL